MSISLGNLFNFITGIFEESRALRGLVETQTADTLCLKCHIDIVVRPASFRATRGSTCVGVLCDEISFWRSEDSSNPDTEILRALRPSLMTTNGPLVAISSPYSRHGELWKAYRKHFGKDGSRALVVKAASEIMNPGLDRAFIDAQYEDDPIAAAAEYGGEFRSDVAAFIDRDIVEGCVDRGVHERLRRAGQQYVCFIDSAGGSGADSFTAAIAHREGNVAILDAIREYRPPFSPKYVVEEIAQWMKSYGIFRAQSDKWGGDFPIEEFAVHLIKVEASAKPKSDLYRDALPMLNSGKCRLLDNPRFVSQLCGLERRVGRGGKDSIDHGPGQHDDIANAACGALLLASAKTQMVISDSVLAWARQPAPVVQREFRSFEGRFS